MIRMRLSAAVVPPSPPRPGNGRSRLARDIAIVLVIKLLALTALWALFFRAPRPVNPADILEPPAIQQEPAR